MDAVFHPAMSAIAQGDLDALLALIAADPTLPERRSSCSHPTLLQMVACEAKNLPDAVGAAAVLADAGAPLAEPLVAAASVDARAVLHFLLERGVPVDGEAGWTPLDEALYWRHLDLARFLVDRGASLGTLRACAGFGDVDGIGRFFDTDGSLRADAGPIRSPFADTVPEVRANDPQDIVDNAFVTAAQNGFQACTGALLERGAQINACPPGFHWKGAALHAAVWRGDEAMVDWLLAHGADPHVRDGMVGGDAAGWARHHGRDSIAQRLARHG